jgi:hypothetical protein
MMYSGVPNEQTTINPNDTFNNPTAVCLQLKIQ